MSAALGSAASPLCTPTSIAAGLGDVEMLFEYQLPLTSKRADVVLAGQHPQTGGPSYLVVELKQWSHAERFEDSDTLIRIEQYGQRPVDPPRAPGPRLLRLPARLHDRPRPTSRTLWPGWHTCTTPLTRPSRTSTASQATCSARVFTGQRRASSRTSSRPGFAPGASGAAYADHCSPAASRLRKQLLAVAAEEVQRPREFVLLDEQRDRLQLRAARGRAGQAGRHARPRSIVSGGPGSGKSVIALSLLGELSRQGRTVLHATGSRSFTQTLRKVAGKRAPRVQKMFQYFNSLHGRRARTTSTR